MYMTLERQAKQEKTAGQTQTIEQKCLHLQWQTTGTCKPY